MICVPGSDDAMLSGQSLAFEDVAWMRRVFAARPALEFEAWRDRIGLGPAQPPLAVADLALRMGLSA